MKTSLQLNMSQSLSMTPQLQQAIRLLQLSAIELQQEIQTALDSNPLLEEDSNEKQEDVHLDALDNYELNTTKEQASTEKTKEDTFDTLNASDALEQKDIAEDLPVDTSWDDVYTSNTGHTGIRMNDDIPIYQGETTESLQDNLLWQLELTPFSEKDKTIAIAIIESINDQGFLTQTCEEILESVGINGVTLDEVETVLKRVQQFDPLGIAARNLQECLLLQLNTYPADTPFLQETKMVLTKHLNLLSNRDYRQLAKVTKLKEHALKEIMQLIHELNPRPGNNIVSQETPYVIPDVSVFKKHGQWVVSMNPDSIPRLKINTHYASLANNRANSSTDTQFIRTHLQEAKWLIKSLESRNETLLKVATCIVKRQTDFFEKGPESMKPMVLNDVALEVDMHESTISRITTQKYIYTPRGIFELKYFFSSHVKTESGGACSSTAIRAVIKKLVAAENPVKPLSDSKIATLLDEKGIKVARRTIAKYRESLGIPPSNQRKSLL